MKLPILRLVFWVQVAFFIVIIIFMIDPNVFVPKSVYTNDQSTNADSRPRSNEYETFLDSLGFAPNQKEELSYYTRMPRYPSNGTGVTVNIADFAPEIFNGFCKTNTHLKCVVSVYSAVECFRSRTLLRQSLGKAAHALGCKMFFIVGASTNQTIQSTLQLEYAREQDMLVIGKLDTYRDLPNKAFALVKWIDTFCLNVPYVIAISDYTFINLKWFLSRLESINNELYILAPDAQKHPVRKPDQDTYITFAEYPFRNFPRHGAGWVNAFPSRVSTHLLSAVFDAYFCWLRDVWMTGHVRLSAGVELIQIPKNQWEDHVRSVGKYGKQVPDIPVCHGVKEDLLAQFYIHSQQ